MRKMIATLLCFAIAVGAAVGVSAEETQQASDITAETVLTGTGYYSYGFLTDKGHTYYGRSEDVASITLENPEGMGSLYILFDLEYGPYTITDNTSGKQFTAGTNDFIHEYIDLVAAFGAAPTSVTLDFANGAVRLGEIYVFSQGQVPDFVQKWEAPLEGKTDILMLPTHGDDDQLFFAGLLPYYAGELDLQVQVAYLTNHRYKTNERVHEILNGLWATGVEAYPVFLDTLDFLTYDKKDAYDVYYSEGITREDLIGRLVEQLRRFKPLVAVGHDINGEYGHGMHKVYADMLMAAVELTNDPRSYPESVQTYGVWDVPKTYLHLWNENPIEINYDIPLEKYGGLTAFQVTQEYGFPCHVSQQKYENFWYWLHGPSGNVTRAVDIMEYNPCQYGLYRSTVGVDVQKNDFLENVTTYEEQERLEQERIEQERLEQERLEQERLEQERLEAERKEQERQEQERLEAERLEQERLEQERLEQERLEQEQQAQQEGKKPGTIPMGWVILILMVSVGIGFHFGKSRVNSQHGRYQKKLKK